MIGGTKRVSELEEVGGRRLFQLNMLSQRLMGGGKRN